MARDTYRYRSKTRNPSLARSRLRQLLFESLEDRIALATYVVNSTANTPDSGFVPSVCDTELRPEADPPIPASGICTLRAAFLSANVNPGFDTIQFAIPGTGIPSIDLERITAFLVEPVLLDGRSQAGGTVELRRTTISLASNTNFSSSGSLIRGITFNEAGIAVQSENNLIVGNFFGLSTTGSASPAFAGTAIAITGSNNTVGGPSASDRNVIGNYAEGISVFRFPNETTSGNTIRGNYIGTNATGDSALPMTDSGISISFASNTLVENNVIAASKFGIAVGGNTETGTVITGNFVGTNVDGTITDPDGILGNSDDFGNGKGIFVNDAPGVMIINNVIAGSTARGTDFGYGIQFANPNASGAVVKGNKIGLNAAGTAPLGNKSDGIFIERASNITIGGTAEADRNIISGNGGDGVTIFGNALHPASNHQILGNYIGVDVTGKLDFGNKFRGVHIDSVSKNNIVGGNAPNARNIISGNDSDGVIIALAGAENNVVKGNYIGIDKDGATPLPNGGSGVRIFEAPNNKIGESDGSSFIRNVISANKRHGVLIQGETASNNVVAGNLIGTDVNGRTELTNDEHGVFILNASLNRIGDVFNGSTSAPGFPGNVIAAKDGGVRIEGPPATRNEVLSNLIGVDITGAKPWTTIANAGVQVIDAPNNRIGVPNVGDGLGGNTISHNRYGIYLFSLLANSGTGSIGTIIGGNFIGTDSSGKVSDPPSMLGNVLEGIEIEGFANNYIGGQPTGSAVLPANIIAGNGTAGVGVIGARAIANTIQGNSIHSNGSLGIDLAGNGITNLDLRDEDAGPNELQNAPYVVPAVRRDGRYELVGTLHSTPSTVFRVEFFANDVADPSGFGEGQTLLGFVEGVRTDTAGNALFSFLPSERPQKGFITATVTNSSGNTSEFSCATPALGIETDGHIFGVTTTDDSRPGSLRRAIELANTHVNANGNLDRITFCMSGSGPHTIRPESQLPTITDPVFIDGLTFTNASVNTNGIESGSNAKLSIELDGSAAGPGTHGLVITGGESIVQAIVINRFQGSGIVLEGKGGNSIDGNFIGTNIAGSSALGNQTNGLLIKDSPNNFVGGFLPEFRNLISGNIGSGIEIFGDGSTNNRIDGNLIGTDASGMHSLPNATGILISDSSNNRIGGGGNVISGNTGNGIRINNTEAVGAAELNLIYANRIGTNAAGTAELHNQNGVRITNANKNVIGGLVDNLFVIGNLISGNLESGVDITSASGNSIQNNLIGTDKTGLMKIGNGQDGVTLGSGATNNFIGGVLTSQGNLISGNTRDGIRIRGSDLLVSASDNLVVGNTIGLNMGGTGVIANSGHGVRVGPNAQKNVIGGSAGGSQNVISGNVGNGITLEGTPGIFGSDASENRVEGNLIGLFANGNLGAPNQIGVFVQSASTNTLGGTVANSGNTISGNNAEGVRIEGTTGMDATGNKIQGNRIGTLPDGESSRGNKQYGVLFLSANLNQLGGDAGTTDDGCTGACNVIAFNGKAHPSGEQRGHGVVVQANAQNLHGTGNSIQRNSVFSNFGRGIDLGNDSFTLNDVGDAHGDPDSGANDLQDYPVVTRIVYSGIDPNDDPVNPLPALGLNKRIYWTLNSSPNRTFAIEFFANDDPDPSGFGEGKQYLATYTIKTDAKGNISEAKDMTGAVRLSTDTRSFYIDLPKTRVFVSATATDTTSGNTSEFSMVDTDGDAIADAWETQNIDHNGDGKIEDWEKGIIDFDENGSADHVTPLFLPGANPYHKDVYVEVDLMVAPGLSQPNQETLDEINTGRMGMSEGFSNAPQALVQNPNGKDGIALHALISDLDLANTRYTDSNPADADVFPDGWNEFDALKSTKFGNPAVPASPGQPGIPSERAPNPNSATILAAKRLVYRYTIFGNKRANRDGTSGLAELPNADNANDQGPFGGNDFQVTLGDWSTAGGTKQQQQGTFMHEIGHTLGLGHGGAVDDGTNYKPNYYSVLNYLWQNPRPGLNGWRLDYSTVDFGDMDESNLNEAAGVITTTIASDRSAALSIANGAELIIKGPWVLPFFEDSPPIDDTGFLHPRSTFYDVLLEIGSLIVDTVLTPTISVNPLVYGAPLPPLTAADINNARDAARLLKTTIASGAMPMATPIDWSRIPEFIANGLSIENILPNLATLVSVPHDGDGRPPGSGNPAAPQDNEELLNGRRDLNHDNAIAVLAGHEDWSKLRFYFLESLDGSADGVHTHTPDDLDEKQFHPEDEIFMDFGDAPFDGVTTRYPTLAADDGARHIHVGLFNPVLGIRADMEADGQPNVNASGDNREDGVDLSGDALAADANDEDGIRFNTPLVPGQIAIITASVQLPIGVLDEAKLDAWLDFNDDGDWDDVGEKFLGSVSVIQGENRIEFEVPAEAQVGTTFVRFRLSSVGGLMPGGESLDGEVEDYEIEIARTPALDVDILRFESNASVPLSSIRLTYALEGVAFPALEFAFFASNSPRFGTTATEIGHRIAISDASLRAQGLHTLVLDAPYLAAALTNPDNDFILVVADPGNIIAESNESNNDLHFVGVFLANDSPAPLVVRGHDIAGRIASNPTDVISVRTNSDLLTIGTNDDSRDVAIARVSELVVLTHSGDDQLWLDWQMPFTFYAGDGLDSLLVTGSSQSIDSLANSDIQNIEILDIRGSGSNGIVLSPADVIRFTAGANPLLLRHDEDDRVELTTNWSIATPIFENGEPLHRVHSIDVELRISNTTPWRNPLQLLDTNRDEFISPLDVLVIINSINENGSRALPTPTNADVLPIHYFDTNGDHFLSPLDVLLVINFLNNSTGVQGESEPEIESVLDNKKLALFASAFPLFVPKPFKISEAYVATRVFDEEDLKRRSMDHYFAAFWKTSSRT